MSVIITKNAQLSSLRWGAGQLFRHSRTSGDQNAYTARLEAIATALRCVPLGLRDRILIVMTSNRSILQVIARPRQQSRQCIIRAIYGSVKFLAKSCKVRPRWVPAKNEEFTLGPLTKMQGKRATLDECVAEPVRLQTRSTTLRLLLNEVTRARRIPEGVGQALVSSRSLRGCFSQGAYGEFFAGRYPS